MATPTRAANVGLYRKLLKAAQSFETYNIRDYAVRYVRDDYRAAAVLSGQEVRPVRLRRPGRCAWAARSPSCRLAPPISQALDAFQHGMTQLEMLRRQSAISQMFPQDRHAAPLRQGVLPPGAAGHGWPLISSLCAGTLSPPSPLLAHGCNDQPSLGWPAYAHAYASRPRFASGSHLLAPTAAGHGGESRAANDVSK